MGGYMVTVGKKEKIIGGLILLFTIVIAVGGYIIFRNSKMPVSISEVDFFDKVKLEERQDLNFYGIKDNKLLYTIYEPNSNGGYKTEMFYMDLDSKEIKDIKVVAEGRIMDFTFDGDNLLYSVVTTISEGKSNLYKTEVIAENKGETVILDSNYTYSQERAPHFTEIGGKIHYIFETLDSEVNRTTVNEIAGMGRKVIFEESMILNSDDYSKGKWFLNAPKIEAYGDKGVFVARRGNKFSLYIIEDGKVVERKMDFFIGGAWVLGENILVQAYDINNPKGVNYNYYIYNVEEDKMNYCKIKGNIYMFAAIDDNKFISTDFSKSTVSVFNNRKQKFTRKVMDKVISDSKGFYADGKGNVYVYKSDFIKDESKNIGYTFEKEYKLYKVEFQGK